MDTTVDRRDQLFEDIKSLVLKLEDWQANVELAREEILSLDGDHEDYDPLLLRRLDVIRYEMKHAFEALEHLV